LTIFEIVDEKTFDMMKKLACRILLVLMILCPLWVNGQDKKAVKHKLKSITEYEQKYEKGVAGKALKQSEIRYDSDGNIMEETEYKLGKVSKHMTYQYDEDNNKICETELDPSGKKIKVTEYKYNDGLKTEKTVYDANNKVVSRKTYKYETY
jgi:hypothetical protein